MSRFIKKYKMFMRGMDGASLERAFAARFNQMDLLEENSRNHMEEIRKIKEVQKLLKKNPKLAWMFANCYPNTLESTVHYRVLENGDDDTFVYTGDIPAMLLRKWAENSVLPLPCWIRKTMALS